MHAINHTISPSQSSLSWSQRKDGSAIVTALLFTLAASLIVVSFTKFSLFELELSHRDHMKADLFYQAEAGLDQAIWAINHGDWTGWSKSGNSRYQKFKGVANGNYKAPTIQVLVQDVDGAPTVHSHSSNTMPDGSTLEKQLRITYAAGGGVGSGLIAKDKLDLSGDPYFDSYDSNRGRWHPTNNYSDNIIVATVSKASDAFKMSSDVLIYGYAGTGKRNISISGGGNRVWGSTTPAGVKFDHSRVSRDFAYDFEPVTQPDWSGASKKHPRVKKGKMKFGNKSGVPKKYKLDKIDLSDVNMVVQGPVQIYLSDGMSISGDAKMTIEKTGSLELYTPKDVTLSGQGIANLTNVPAKARFFGTVNKEKDQSLTLSGQSEMQATFYMPNAVVQVSGQVDLSGSVVGYEIKFSGQTKFHYDVQLGDGGGDPQGVSSWHELTSTYHRINMNRVVANMGITP